MQFIAITLGLLACFPLAAATLEKLSIEQMAQQSTIIVRGKVTGCAGETRGSIIYTRCGVAVSETWKGAPRSKVDFIVPGGRVASVSQTFTGAPQFNANEQYVLFLWVGRSGVPQIMGLSQGVFDVSAAINGSAKVGRAAASELMLDATGKQVKDEPVAMGLSDLRRRVDTALAEGSAR